MAGMGIRSSGRGTAGNSGADSQADSTTTWQEEMMKRLRALRPGFRYTITLTVGHNGNCDWTVDEGLKVERPRSQ